MRVVFVIPYFYPAWQYGGTPRAAFEYARSLADRGHSVTVLTTDSLGASRQPEVTEREPINIGGIEVYYYRNLSNRLAFKQRLFWPVTLFRDLEVRLRGADILHVHDLRSSLTVKACATARSMGLPYVISPHGGLRRMGKALPKRIFDQLWGYRILKTAAAVAVLSDSEMRDAGELRVPPDRVSRLPNSVPSDPLPETPSGIFRARWNLGDVRIVAFLGRLHRIKGADILLRAFCELLHHDGGVHLVIAGPDDGQEKELRALASDAQCKGRVTFTGFLDAAAKAELFADASVLVVPSRSEAFPVTVLEALLWNLPVLLSDSCDLIRVFTIDHGVAAFRSEDEHDLSEKLRWIFSSNSLRSNVAKGRALVQRDYSAEAVGRALERLYNSVLHRGLNV